MNCMIRLFSICLALVIGLTTITYTLEPAFQELSEQLQIWDQRLQTIANIKSTIKTLDVMSEPENDDRSWWNPFWRANQKRQLQQLNELTLTVQHLEELQQTQFPVLKRQLEQFINDCRQSTDLSKDDLMLWRQADAWRFDQFINKLDINLIKQQLSSSTNQELLTNKQEQLVQYIIEAQALSEYITEQLTHADEQSNKFYQQWLNRLEDKIKQATLPEPSLQ